MRSHVGLKCAAMCVAFNVIMMFGYPQFSFCQKRPVSSSASASFSVRPVFIVPDDGASDLKAIKGARILPDDLEALAPPELGDELRSELFQRENGEIEVVYRGKVAKEASVKKKTIVFVNN